MPMPPIFGVPTFILSQIGPVLIDAVLSETHHFEADITQHPIEDGSIVSDHIVLKPFVLEMEGRITDTPFPRYGLGQITGALSAFGPPGSLQQKVIGSAGAIASLVSTGGIAGAAKTGWQSLVTLQTSRSPFTVVTGLDVYKNMMFKMLSAPRSAADGRSIKFNGTLQQMEIVGVRDTTVRSQIVEELLHSFVRVTDLGMLSPF